MESAPDTIFDSMTRSLRGLPDVTEGKPTNVTTYTPLRDQPESWIVRTWRHRERGDFIFIEYIGPEGAKRIAIPPQVCAVIARQRDALASRNRKRAAKEEAARRKELGIVPGFMKAKRKGGAK